VANTLTNLVPTVIATMMRVKRSTGAILNAVNTDLSDEAMAHNQTVTIGKIAPVTEGNVTPGATAPALVDSVVPGVPLVLNQYKQARFHVTAEEWRAMARSGPEFRIKQIDACVAKLLDTAGAYVAGLAAAAGALAYGTAGTTPFASNAKIIADLAEALDHLKAPQSDRFLILNTLAKRNIFQLDNFIKANEAPEGLSFAAGTFRELGGMMVGMDQNVATKTKGDGALYVVDEAAGYAPGATTIKLKTGTGTILAGDVVAFGASPVYKYVVETGITAAGSIVLRTPLRESVADAAAVAISAGVRNFACHRDAIALALRPPVEAPGGDAADDVEIVTDPETGLSLRLASYPGYHARQYELSVLYGASVVDNNLLAALLG
jgi:hypothetical protein